MALRRFDALTQQKITSSGEIVFLLTNERLAYFVTRLFVMMAKTGNFSSDQERKITE